MYCLGWEENAQNAKQDHHHHDKPKRVLAIKETGNDNEGKRRLPCWQSEQYWQPAVRSANVAATPLNKCIDRIKREILEPLAAGSGCYLMWWQCCCCWWWWWKRFWWAGGQAGILWYYWWPHIFLCMISYDSKMVKWFYFGSTLLRPSWALPLWTPGLLYWAQEMMSKSYRCSRARDKAWEARYK